MRNATNNNVVNTAAVNRCAVNGKVVVRVMGTQDIDRRSERCRGSLRQLCLYLRDGLAVISQLFKQAIIGKPAAIAFAPAATGTRRGTAGSMHRLHRSQPSQPSRWRRSSQTLFSHR
jgi:hypothetical protein